MTGIFGGVIGSVVLAIATDLFEPHQRGRVMGFIQTAFAASQILVISTSVPEMTKRGAYNALGAAFQQVSGGSRR